jgi:ferredoxin, 2Fe-2S
MAKITFIEPNGNARTVEGGDGHSVMEVAIRHGIEGIEAECGGARACATCHVYVTPEWRGVTGEANGDEAEMLEFAAAGRQAGSRLSCQLRVRAALDGLVVRIPDRQR